MTSLSFAHVLSTCHAHSRPGLGQGQGWVETQFAFLMSSQINDGSRHSVPPSEVGLAGPILQVMKLRLGGLSSCPKISQT